MDGLHILLPGHLQLLVTEPGCTGRLAAQIPLGAAGTRLRALADFDRARRRLPLRRAAASRPVIARLALCLRALDGTLDGTSYREIAVGLFGARHVPKHRGVAHQ